MRLSKKIAAFTMLFVMGFTLLAPASQAVSKNRKAGEAYAAALEKGTIKYTKSMNYNIADMDGDGVKDLLVSGSAGNSFVYSYKNGAVKKILDYAPEYDLCYSAKKHLFVENGEGDGAWHIFHKLKGGKLVEKFRYYTQYKNDSELSYFYQKAGGEAQELSKEEYTKKLEDSGMEYLQTSKKKLINKLKKLN